jgi:two-component system sensor histidine kinase RpfC
MSSVVSSGVFDPSKLAMLAEIGEGRAFAAEVVACFLADAVKRLDAAEAAFVAADLATWTRETHTLKSAAAAVGAEALRERCLAYETAGREKRAPTAEDVAALRGEFARAEAALRGWVAG